MFFSEAYQHALLVQTKLLSEAMEEVEEYCRKNEWLSAIYTFCREWSDESLQAWRGVQAFNIEVNS